MDPEELLLIGKIVAAHGIKGEVKVYPYVDQQSHLTPGKEILVEPPGKTASPYIIRGSRVHKKVVCIGLEGVSNRSSAEELVGSCLFMPRFALPQPEADTWYWCDLIGLEVYDKKEGFIGQVDAMIETGANDVFVVKNSEAERLIPAIEPVVRSIDTETGRILVELPEGL
ncbi:MAG: ribosome maturation factor RimM [Desulfobacteraceae bacterium]|nr:ribosome maturation factor RimM [Desulfobacteraceae bacterium]MCF8095797.1 ribosome maturation factor RimM [Desulfobacteraceae bacterium]